MRRPRFTVVGLIAIAIAGVSLGSVSLEGQAGPGGTRPSDPAARSGPRTAWGAPDLQGTWSTATVTPLERPAGVGEFLTEAEIAEIERRAVAAATDEARGANQASDVAGAYNDFWWDRGTRVAGNRRTSLIFDPPNGKIPALTAAARKYADSPEARRVQETRRGDFPAASWEDTDLWDRCLTRGLPMLSGPYNNNFQIFQTSDYLVVLHEMIHDARIIPIGKRADVATAVPQWFGTATARWEGDTLVVDTKDFSPKQELPFEPRTSAAGMHLIERFTRLNDGTLNYEFTVDHPATYSRPWTAAIPMRKSEGSVYEYACHEGNYGIVGILKGSRATEKAAAEAARKRSR